MVRVLVCGGRQFEDRDMLNAALDKLHQERGFISAPALSDNPSTALDRAVQSGHRSGFGVEAVGDVANLASCGLPLADRIAI